MRPRRSTPDDRWLARFAGLLEAGAGHLDGGAGGYREQRRRRRCRCGRWRRSPRRARPRCWTGRPGGGRGGGGVAGGPAGGADRGERVGGRRGDGRPRPVLAGRGGLLADSITLVRAAAGHPGRAGGRADRLAARPDAGRGRRPGEGRGPRRGGGPAAGPRRGQDRRAAAGGGAGGRCCAPTPPPPRSGWPAAIRDAVGARCIPGGTDGHPGGGADPAGRAGLPAALEAYAEDCATPGDERTKDQRMADCLADLILRPGDQRPPVQIGADRGRRGGHADRRRRARRDRRPAGARRPGPRTGLRPRPAPATRRRRPDRRRPDAGRGRRSPRRDRAGRHRAEPTPTTRARRRRPSTRTPTAGAARDRLRCRRGRRPLSSSRRRGRLGELLGLRSIAGTALAHLPQIAIVEEISGQLLALTDATGIRHAATCAQPACRTGTRPCTHPPRGPASAHRRPPPATAPPTACDRFVRARDRRCRFPGCRAAAIRCDLDHTTRWPAGADQRRQPVLPVPPPPPAQPPGPRLDHDPPPRRRPAMDHPRRRTPSPPTRSRYGTDDDLPQARPTSRPLRTARPGETARHARTTPPLAPTTTGPRRRRTVREPGRRSTPPWRRQGIVDDDARLRRARTPRVRRLGHR